MNADSAQGLINQILYGIDSEPDLDSDALIEHHVEAMIGRRRSRTPVEEYAEALATVLRDGRLPAGLLPVERHSGADLLAFLDRLARRLDERRPWPRPPFVALDADQWAGFATAEPIARIDRSLSDLQGVLRGLFDALRFGARRVPVIMLELASGDVVAVVGRPDPRSGTFTLMQRDPGDPAEVIARFRECTGLSPRDVVPIPR